MDNVSDVCIKPTTKSNYVNLMRMHYNQDGVSKTWDLINSHDSVAIVIRNVTRDVLLFVKQFRPAIYYGRSQVKNHEDGNSTISTENYPGSLGVTHELCAGIVDKDKTLTEIAQEEVLEECGYKVPLDSLERVSAWRSNVGLSGSQMTIFYVEVTDDMKVGAGGGSLEEGERIEVVEIPVSDCLKFAFDEDIPKPVGLAYALLWFWHHRK